MNFFLVSNMYPTEKHPGYGSFVRNVSEGLTELGMKEKCKSVIKGRPSSKVNKIIKYLNFYISILINYWKKYDFIYIHFPNQAVPILYPLLKLKQKKLIVNLHGEDLIYSSTGYGNKLGKMMEKLCRQYADAIVVPSEYFKRLVIDRRLISSDRIIVSPSGGINSNIFYPDNDRNYDLTQIHLGYVGRMERDKGIVEFVNVCKKLNYSNTPFKATAIGYGSIYTTIKEYIIQNGLSDKVVLIEGIVQPKLGNYYRSFDLLIFSSSSRTGESLGLTGIEAMACGVPVIGSNIGGIASYVVDGENGWLTPVKDVDAIFNRINNYIALAPEEKRRVSTNASKTGERYYSDSVCENLKQDILKEYSENT